MRREDGVTTSRASMDHQQNRVVTILAADSNPLVYSAYPGETLLNNPASAFNL
jgi:hypothetical protein